MNESWENARVTVVGRSVHISDGNPADAALRRNARDVHQYSGELLAGVLTEGELRFICKNLREALSDVLGMSED